MLLNWLQTTSDQCGRPKSFETRIASISAIDDLIEDPYAPCMEYLPTFGPLCKLAHIPAPFEVGHDPLLKMCCVSSKSELEAKPITNHKSQIPKLVEFQITNLSTLGFLFVRCVCVFDSQPSLSTKDSKLRND